MTHAQHRPTPLRRMCSEPHYPVRESDGPAYVGVMVDARQAHIAHARDTAATFLQQARAARLAGDAVMWSWHMSLATAWRKQFAEVRS